MEFGIKEIIEASLVGGGGLGFAIKKYFYPMYKTWAKNKAEERKLIIKSDNDNSDEVTNIYKTQYEELKVVIKEKDDKITDLTEKYIEAKTRVEFYAKKKVLHSRGGKKKKGEE